MSELRDLVLSTQKKNRMTMDQIHDLVEKTASGLQQAQLQQHNAAITTTGNDYS